MSNPNPANEILTFTVPEQFGGFRLDLCLVRFCPERSRSRIQTLIAETRMETARRLLATTSLTIKEIAALSGFTTLEYFSRAFTSATGLAPTEWREKVSEAHG